MDIQPYESGLQDFGLEIYVVKMIYVVHVGIGQKVTDDDLRAIKRGVLIFYFIFFFRTRIVQYHSHVFG